ncbi:Eukaryotic translation initiation factor 4E transporter [Dirofilaria immitis]
MKHIGCIMDMKRDAIEMGQLLIVIIISVKTLKVFLGQLPVDFLRIAIPSPTSIQEQQQQSMVPFYIGDPNLVTQQALLQAQGENKEGVINLITSFTPV